MPNGQDRYADKARKRSPRKGQPIHIGKLGAASVEGAVTDVARELLPLMSSVSEGTWKRLGKWAVALARTEGITPDNDVRNSNRRSTPTSSSKEESSPTEATQVEARQIHHGHSINTTSERKAREYYNLSDTIGFYEEFRDKLLERGDTEEAAKWEKRLEELNTPAVQQQWDEWFEWYHQVECSIDGQRRAKLSPEEREAEDRKLELARQEFRNNGNVAAD